MDVVLDTRIARLDGTPTTIRGLTGGMPALLVNVASKCGLTPQYLALEALQAAYSDRGFTVVGIPCNQFRGQEPGAAEEIASFCSATYGVTFPMTEKVEVNGPGRHPLYNALVASADAIGSGGDVQWNFEKFLIAGDGTVVARFEPMITPDDPRVVRALEELLARHSLERSAAPPSPTSAAR
jgi:glutathione peroxidase